MFAIRTLLETPWCTRNILFGGVNTVPLHSFPSLHSLCEWSEGNEASAYLSNLTCDSQRQLTTCWKIVYDLLLQPLSTLISHFLPFLASATLIHSYIPLPAIPVKVTYKDRTRFAMLPHIRSCCNSTNILEFFFLSFSVNCEPGFE